MMTTAAQTHDSAGGVMVAESIIQDALTRLTRLADENDFTAIRAAHDAGRQEETFARINAATVRLAEQHMIAYAVAMQHLADTAERASVLERIHTAYVTGWDALNAFLLTVGPGYRLDAPEGGAQ